MIVLKNIQKTYVTSDIKNHVLKDINLRIMDGEIVAIKGTSGSGKTTLLNIIGCMDQASEGSYTYISSDGSSCVEVTQLSRKQMEAYRRNHIGFVFQQFALLQDYTIYQNVEMPLRARRIPVNKRKAIVENALNKCNIEDVKDALPAKVSGGQQQRCAIARAIASGADMILADEPTGSLDSVTSREIMKYLLEVRNLGKTIIIVTHDDLVAQCADRIICIEDGTNVEQNQIGTDTNMDIQ